MKKNIVKIVAGLFPVAVLALLWVYVEVLGHDSPLSMLGWAVIILGLVWYSAWYIDRILFDYEP